VRWCPWPLSPQVIAPCSTGYELLQLPKQRRSFGAPGLLSRLAALPGERQAAARRAGHRSPAQFLIHHTASLTISGVRSKLVRPGANACTPRAAAPGAITTTPASSPPPVAAGPAAILTGRYSCVHLDAGCRVPSGRPGDPPTVRICLITRCWRRLINDYLGYLADRGYSPQTVRAYAFDLLAFARWLAAERLALGEVSADVVLRYLAYCRRALLPGRAGGNVYSIRDGATSAMRLRRSTAGWPLCQACSATRRCRTRLRPAPSRVAPRHAGRRWGAQRAAGPPGPAETALWPAGRRAAAVAPRPGPREPAALLASFRTD